jgi:hypothetical protein
LPLAAADHPEQTDDPREWRWRPIYKFMMKGGGEMESRSNNSSNMKMVETAARVLKVCLWVASWAVTGLWVVFFAILPTPGGKTFRTNVANVVNTSNFWGKNGKKRSLINNDIFPTGPPKNPLYARRKRVNPAIGTSGDLASYTCLLEPNVYAYMKRVVNPISTASGRSARYNNSCVA